MFIVGTAEMGCISRTSAYLQGIYATGKLYVSSCKGLTI